MVKLFLLSFFIYLLYGVDADNESVAIAQSKATAESSSLNSFAYSNSTSKNTKNATIENVTSKKSPSTNEHERSANCSGPNESIQCVRKCPPLATCDNRNKIVHCPMFNSTTPCTNVCACNKGFYRNSDGFCVTSQLCDKKCTDPNEEYKPDKKKCPSGLCSSIWSKFACNPKEVGQPGCVCKPGYLRRTANSTCIPAKECPQLGHLPDYPNNKNCSLPNESIQCVRKCPPLPTCNNRKEIFNCPFFNSTTPCTNVCVCNKGFYRNSEGFCVTSQLCDRKCKDPNEEYKPDKKKCPNDFCSSIVSRFACDPEEVGQPGCVCKPGFLRLAANSTCIPMTQCPELANSPDNHDSTCGENEIMNNCPSPACEYCPSSDKEARACLATSQKVCPPPKCMCRNNYRRLHNGTCVPTRECPSFKCPRVNEEFDPCPLCSTDNCSRATPDGTCKVIGRIGIPLQCRPSCRCKKNYWRDGDRCVPYESCPNVPKKCTKPHESLKCTTSCPRPRTCFGRHIRYKCPDVTAQVCKDECVCDDGYYRNSDGFCVTSDLCDKKCTGPNEVYKADKKTCPPETCRSIVARYKCDSKEVGEPGCVCKPGFLRLSLNSTCIPMKECPELKNSPDYNKPECKLPHESLKCVKVCPPPKTCNNRFVEVSCLYIANETCTHKCVCDDGFYRNKDGQCVTGDQCSDNCSKPNESIQCVKSCPRPRTCVGRHIRYRCLNNTDEVCQNKCLCNNGFYRNSDGFCVTSDLCDKKCGPNEEYKADKKSCPSDLCSSLGKQYKCDSKERGQPGCVCKEGFRRMNSMSPCIPEDECPEYINLFPPVGKCSDSGEVSESTNSKTPFIFDIEYWYILDVVPEKEMDSDEDFTRK